MNQPLHTVRVFDLSTSRSESRRADSNSLTLLITSVQSVVAEGCKSRISKRLSSLRVARCCTVLRSRWCQCGVNLLLVSTFARLGVGCSISYTDFGESTFYERR
jgi:hypothetical protein